MTWFLAILVVLAMGGVAALAAGHGAPLRDADRDLPPSGISDQGPVGAEDLRRVRFPLAFRGYRMADVDHLLDRLAAEREHSGPGGDGPRPPG